MNGIVELGSGEGVPILSLPGGISLKTNQEFMGQIYLEAPGSAVKNLPAMQEQQETWVQSLGHEDPLEKGMVVHSSILAWKISGTETTGRLQSVGLQRIRHD